MWVDIFELKNYLGEQITALQKATDISLYDLSTEIFGDDTKLFKVFDSFDEIHKLDNALAERNGNDFNIQ